MTEASTARRICERLSGGAAAAGVTACITVCMCLLCFRLPANKEYVLKSPM